MKLNFYGIYKFLIWRQCSLWMNSGIYSSRWFNFKCLKLSQTLPRNGKVTWWYYLNISNKSFFCTPFTHYLFMEQYVHIWFNFRCSKLSQTLPGNGKVTWWYYLYISSKSFSFLFFFFLHPFHTLLVYRTICTYFYLLWHIHLFFLLMLFFLNY